MKISLGFAWLSDNFFKWLLSQCWSIFFILAIQDVRTEGLSEIISLRLNLRFLKDLYTFVRSNGSQVLLKPYIKNCFICCTRNPPEISFALYSSATTVWLCTNLINKGVWGPAILNRFCFLCPLLFRRAVLQANSSISSHSFMLPSFQRG